MLCVDSATVSRNMMQYALYVAHILVLTIANYSLSFLEL